MPAAADFDYSIFVMAEYLVPSITVYNRLEAIPRAADFDRSLKAEVRDALWMLTRQWQFGEFKGEDAATAVTTLALSSAVSTHAAIARPVPVAMAVPVR